MILNEKKKTGLKNLLILNISIAMLFSFFLFLATNQENPYITLMLLILTVSSGVVLLKGVNIFNQALEK
jgi:hypothetical protein